MPCSGTANRIFVFKDILNNLLPWLQAHPNHTVVLGGDINCDLDVVGPVSDLRYLIVLLLIMVCLDVTSCILVIWSE